MPQDCGAALLPAAEHRFFIRCCFFTFRLCLEYRTEDIAERREKRILRIRTPESLDSGYALFQEGAEFIRPPVQVVLKIVSERFFAIRTVDALFKPFSAQRSRIAVSALHDRIADIAGFLPRRCEFFIQRLTGEGRIIQVLHGFDRFIRMQGLHPVKNHPVAVRNIFLVCTEDLHTHGLDMTGHDDVDVV